MEVTRARKDAQRTVDELTKHAVPGSAEEQGSRCVAVVGLGKIGLPLAVQYARHGWRVIGCDRDAAVVKTINAGDCHILEEPELAQAVSDLVACGQLSATSDTTRAVRSASVVVVIVPLMIDTRHQLLFGALDAATEAIAKGIQPGSILIYETTMPVGTTMQRLVPALERVSGLRVGQGISVAYSPERVSSGQIFHDLRTYPKVVGGVTERCCAAAVDFYRSVLEAEIITMSSTGEAEFVKLIETTYRDVNIALANEFACYADAHGVQVGAAIAAANTQPYSHIHTPGVGVGGHCIPVYPYFLLNGLDEASTQLSLPRMARLINDDMARYAVQQLEVALGSLRQRSVLILGVAYRGDVRETACTSASRLQAALNERGALVYVDDPLFSMQELYTLGYLPLPAGRESEIDALVLQAAHMAYSALDLGRFTRCLACYDGRNAFTRERVERHGMQYLCPGGVGDVRVDGRYERRGVSIQVVDKSGAMH